MLNVKNESNEDKKQELLDIMNKNGITFPFYMLRAYKLIAGVFQDDKTWYTRPFRSNGEEFLGCDSLSLDHGIEYAFDRVKYFRKFKSEKLAERMKDKLENMDISMRFEVRKIESIDDMLK